MNCNICSKELKKIRTNFSLFFKEGDILIKNYPIYVCGYCGNMDISTQDKKKTAYFLKQHKRNNYKKLS